MRATWIEAAVSALAGLLLGCVTAQAADPGGPSADAMLTKAHEYCRARGQEARIELDLPHAKTGSSERGISRRPSGQLAFRCVDGPVPHPTAPSTPAPIAATDPLRELDRLEQWILRMCRLRAKRSSEPFEKCSDENLAAYRAAP